MFTNSNLQVFLNAGILLISFVAFFDVLIKFKKPLLLKTLLLLNITAIAVSSFGQLFIVYVYYFKIITNIPTYIIALTSLVFFFQLHKSKWNIYINSTCAFLMALIVFIPFYFHYKYGLSFKTDYYLNLNTAFIIKAFRIFFTTFFIISFSYILYILNYKFDTDNLYYKKFKIWFRFLIWVLLIAIVFRILQFLFPTVFIYSFIASIFAHLSPLILTIYRPSILNLGPKSISSLGIFTNTALKGFPSDFFFQQFFTNLYFLNENASTQDFSKTIDVKQDQLSDFLRTNYNFNFTEMVNKSRIDYFVELAKRPESKLVTIESLSKQSGFSSRQNMNKFFKRFHGGVPSDLFKI